MMYKKYLVSTWCIIPTQRMLTVFLNPSQVAPLPCPDPGAAEQPAIFTSFFLMKTDFFVIVVLVLSGGQGKGLKMFQKGLGLPNGESKSVEIDRSEPHPGFVHSLSPTWFRTS